MFLLIICRFLWTTSPCWPITIVAFNIGKFPIFSFFINWMNRLKFVSFKANVMPPLPNEFFSYVINVDLFEVDALVKKQCLQSRNKSHRINKILSYLSYLLCLPKQHWYKYCTYGVLVRIYA